MTSRLLRAAVVLAVALPALGQAAAGPEPAQIERIRQLTARGARYLLAAQDRDGAWAGDRGPGISALALKALIQEPTVGPDHPAVKRGVEFVLRSQRSDGGVYASEGLLKNYETGVTVSMLAAFPDQRYRKQLDDALKFLKDNQWDEGEGRSLDDPWYGGAGYGHGKRPDLSNTQVMLDALHDSGLPPDDPAYRKALQFVQRCQMLGESNDQPFARGSTQGGFIYSPANGGESKAGEIEVDGRRELRCYGSMTYAGYKSLLYCGLTPDDPRMQAAGHWIRRNWTLDYNPNMPAKQSHEGLFYYYHVFGRTLRAMQTDVVLDAASRPHNWRQELLEKLAALQRADGSWVNDADRWMEGHPALTTAYALLALHEAAK